MANLTSTFEHEGTTYHAELGTINQILDGPEGHNIPAWNLSFDFNGAGQTMANRRTNTVSGRELLNNFLRAFRAYRLQDMQGKQVYALRTQHLTGAIVGVVDAFDPTQFFIFDDLG